MDGSGYGNPDRGWNDPPKLAFSPAGAGTPAGPGRHRLLNKRVPIPLNPQAGTAPPPVSPSLKVGDGPPVKSGIPLHPPPVSPCPPPPTTTSSVPGAAVAPGAGGADTPASQELLDQVHSSLSDALKAVSEKLKESTHKEVRKRLDVMVDMWRKDQLSTEVQRRLLTLSEALSKQDYDKAWSLHQSLIVDYTTTCSPWMVGIKTLIAESRGSSEAADKQDGPEEEGSEKNEGEDAGPEKGDVPSVK